LKSKDKIVINSSTKNLHVIRDFVEKHFQGLNIDSNIQNQILVSIDEACTNIIKHTYKYDNGHEIEISLDLTDKQISVYLKYKGDGFDPTNKDNPDMKEYFEKFKVGGLGIPLMKKSMDSIEFKHTKPDCNCLKLTKHLSL